MTPKSRRGYGPTERRPLPAVLPPTLPSVQSNVIAAACAIAAFIVYLRTLHPSIPGGDGGELIVVAHTLGIAHPPGFPLYTLLAKAFSLIPIESVAWRVNSFSALCDALATFVLCRAVCRWTGRLWSGVLAALVFAFSPLVWVSAVSAEVFGLNNLFVAILMWITVEATHAAERRRWLAPLGMFVLGLGLANHPTLVFYGVPIALYLVLLLGRRLREPRLVALLIGSLVLGLSPYLYLPFAALSGPPVAWGDPTSWNGLLTHVTRKEYGTFQLAAEGTAATSSLIPRLWLFVRQFGTTTFWLGPLFVLVSLVPLARRSATRGLGLTWLASLVLYVVVFSALANMGIEQETQITIQDRFWQQAIVVAAALMGVALTQVAAWGPWGRRLIQPLVAVALPLSLLTTHWSAMDHRDRHLIGDYGRAVLASLPANAVLFMHGDTEIGSVRYMQWVEGFRQDVSLVATGLLVAPWYRGFAERALPSLELPGTSADGAFTCRALIDANIATHPIFLVNQNLWLETLEDAYTPWAVGLANRLLPKGDVPPLEVWIEDAPNHFAAFDGAKAAALPERTYERTMSRNYWKRYQRYGFDLATVARVHREDPVALRKVIEALEAVAAKHPAPSPFLYKNLGVAYRQLSRSEPSAMTPMIDNWRQYLAADTTGDPDRQGIRLLIEQAEKAQALDAPAN